ncbi:MAG TPA: universal stress protein [Candidatus Eisenbacteria bacterium]|nr:universal stress protein [Candidatus Eisenbacteria bacterium]
MYSRILFAVDDDEALPAAVPVVAAYARRWDADVRVLHVHRIDPSAPSTPSRRLVRELVERLQSEGVSAEGEVRLVEGAEKAARVIARAARQEEADLVAIGSHGRSDLGALFLGSVSHAVASGLDIPVLVLRAGSRNAVEPGTVLVAVDGSAGSDRAVAEAAELADRFGASVLVLHVRQLVAAPGAAAVDPAEDARAIVSRAVAALEERRIQATGESVVEGSVATGIVTAAERHGVDLVVLGSRRPSDLGGLLLGSVAHDVVRRLRCPVLLARRAGAAEPVG